SQTVFQSMWIDMPRSLLSLDFSTKMLHYIVSQETIDRLTEGNRAEREQKYRSLWKKKDPTPKTEYNELMAEYYRRIDYAYQNFSSSTQPGFDTDQGRIYITYGPPRDKERKFPTSGSTVEIWTYPNKEFIFRATSGFGDFRLVSEQNRKLKRHFMSKRIAISSGDINGIGPEIILKYHHCRNLEGHTAITSSSPKLI